MKINEQDEVRLKELEENYADVITNIGILQIRKIQLEEQEQYLKDRAKELLVEQENLTRELTERYGDGFLEEEKLNT
ncbi:MAG: hypothetical protein VW683_00525 [Betaproteobacteria bacterium]|jgi:hypothetical protein